MVADYALSNNASIQQITAHFRFPNNSRTRQHLLRCVDKGLLTREQYDEIQTNSYNERSVKYGSGVTRAHHREIRSRSVAEIAEKICLLLRTDSKAVERLLNLMAR